MKITYRLPQMTPCSEEDEGRYPIATARKE